VLGRPLPARFRRWTMRFADPDRLLVELVDWLEQGDGAGEPEVPAERSSGGRAQPDERAERERVELALACIELRRRVPSQALADSLHETLAKVGVRPFESDGEDFDPDRHRAVGKRGTDDAALHNRVAATEWPGYLDHDRVLVHSEVVVYRAGAQREAV
jgi:hypothetical protein